MLHAWRKLMIAPAATNRSEPSNDIVSCDRGYEPTEIHDVPHVAGMLGYGMPGQLASRNQAMSAPRTAARPSDRPCCCAFDPSPWSALIVVAAAVPLGKGSCSMLIICRFAGTARKTPSIEITRSQV